MNEARVMQTMKTDSGRCLRNNTELWGEDNLLFEKKNTGFYATALAYEMK